MKKIQRITSTIGLILTVSILLCFLSGCDLVIHPPEDGTVGADMGKPTEKVTEKLQKEYCTATADGDFVSDKVLIKLFPEYEKIEYTVEDFANIGCVSLKDNTPKGDHIKCYIIQLDKKSRDNVILQIKELEKREDIYSASPVYGFVFDLLPSDYNAKLSSQWAIEKLQLPDAWDINTDLSQL